MKALEIFQLKQGFNSFDLISMLATVTAVLAISGPIVYRGVQSEKIETAKEEMKKIAHDPHFLMSSSPATRTVASINETPMSQPKTDPWGQPYRTEILKNAYGQPTHLVVWSSGPNGIADTSEILPTSKHGVTAVVFQGDDIGYVVPIK